MKLESDFIFILTLESTRAYLASEDHGHEFQFQIGVPMTRLATAAGCAVFRCCDGCYHLQVGTTTLRLSPTQMQQLATVIAEASVLAEPVVVDGLRH
jgi:hypothetical protein